MVGVGCYGVASAAFLCVFTLFGAGWIDWLGTLSALIISIVFWSILGCFLVWQFEAGLFKPFASIKKVGFSIGMDRCRIWIGYWREQLSVARRRGVGATTSISLPLTSKRHVAAEIGVRDSTCSPDPDLPPTAHPIGEHAA